MTTVNITTTKNTVEVNETTNVVTVQQGAAQTVEVITQGPQGVAGQQGQQGATGAGIPTLGDPGNIIIKSSYTNYDIEWASTLDGGTFN